MAEGVAPRLLAVAVAGSTRSSNSAGADAVAGDGIRHAVIDAEGLTHAEYWRNVDKTRVTGRRRRAMVGPVLPVIAVNALVSGGSVSKG